MDILFEGTINAFRIYESNMPLEEKIRLWGRIIHKRPEEELDERLHPSGEKYLHGFLEKYIGIKKQLLEELKKNSDNDIFTYAYATDRFFSSENYSERPYAYRSFRECLTAATAKTADEIIIFRRSFSDGKPLRMRISGQGMLLDIIPLYPVTVRETFILYHAFPKIRYLDSIIIDIDSLPF